MNEFIDLLAKRRTVPIPKLEGPGPDAEELQTLLTIAARVPDHGKLVPWRFLVIEGEARQRIGEVIAAAFQADEPSASPERIAQERGRLAHAPLVVGVVSSVRPHAKIPDWEQQLCAGAVCMNLIVAARAMGFSATWLTQWFAFDRRVLDVLGLEPHERMAGFLHVGRPREIPADRDRPDLAKIVTRL
ncbi:nitroreductase family protein [Enterovirga rhinocerotis]|uniref:Putative NAD(P)H nitroreductase n=1 Tax=Enterovirga rhinocerotis TaxID=1339210 RepID=A0A4R7CAA9_9HYPH|nr:nitroreductase [Enterovirga rhinocerotis]TDR93737.1 nitroreductase [Enterovirga rhinocerotis]